MRLFNTTVEEISVDKGVVYSTCLQFILIFLNHVIGLMSAGYWSLKSNRELFFYLSVPAISIDYDHFLP